MLSAALFSGCNKDSTESGQVYYINFKPEADRQWKELAKIYTKETGVPVTILTAASGQYATTLKSELAKTEAPTLFQCSSPVGLKPWKEYCYDLKDSKLYAELTNDSFVLKDGEAIAGITYVIESYGIIYNKALLNKAGYTEADIKNFAGLKRVAEDITARKDELGFAAFTSAGMDGSSDWRFKTHLANLPIYYEYKAEGIDDSPAIKGLFLPEYKNIWDLYINNSTTSPSLLSTKTGDDAVAEFVTEQAVFYQNGTWAYTDISDLGDENLGMIPIYIGAEGEENQGLCTGTENYWCVNKNAPQVDIDATLEFLYWCVTSEEGTNALCNEMGFTIPFKGNFPASNPLVNIANDYVANGFTPVTWAFNTIPSENWKSDVGSALTAYAAGTGGWENVETAFIDGWAKEYEIVG
ncbi:MAG: ABC transporter substrate-binding protein [Ruminococcus sp.]|nr:ABC transporter substrate-binding protein [Ruminococcus sp.]